MTHKTPLKPLAAGLTAAALTLTLIPAQAAKTTFRDVDDEIWYASAVAFCQQRELMDGVSGSAFDPDGLMTRGTLAEALYRLAGTPAQKDEPPELDGEKTDEAEDTREDGLSSGDKEESGEEAPSEEEAEPAEPPFSDVGEDHPNLEAIRWAKENGVISGYEDRFEPDAPITREQIAAILWNGQGQPEPDGSANFSDGADISGWASDSVAWVYGAKLMQGTPEGQFLPQNNTSRAQGAVIIMNYAQNFYGLQPGYDLPKPQTIPANPYFDDGFSLDENGYLSYYDNRLSCRGLDVSAHQKEIDWQKVAAAGMDFAMIRAGYRGYVSGLIVKDEYFDRNIQGALSNGIEVGVYFFSQALTPREAEEEAYQLLEWIRDYPVTYPVVFDWEEQDKEDSRTQGADGNTVTACALAFCKVIEDAGYLPMLYGSPKKIYTQGIMLEYLQDYPFWLAHYTKDTAPTSFLYKYHMWQYSSSGHVDGIEGNVDLNLCMVDWSNWEESRRPWWIGPA